MRPSRFFVLLALGLSFVSAANAQDFDPRGRRRPPVNPGPGPGRPPRPAEPKGPQQGVLIERYTRIVLAQPGAPFPLQRLAQLYRERDGNLAKLLADFEPRAAQPGPNQLAATTALAGLYRLDARPLDAIRTYEKAVALDPKDPAALLALARLLQDRGDLVQARQRFVQALALRLPTADREPVLRTVMGLALDQKDWESAKRFHSDLVKLQPTSLFVRGELGRELFARGEFERAEAEFKELVTAATGDNRTLAPALKELGRAQARAHKPQDAIATLKRALAAAGQEAAVRAEIYEIIAEIYRADQQLPVLVKQLEDEHPTDFARLALLGGLYEETGAVTKAIETYGRALAVNPRHIDLRLRRIRLLQANGELDQAINEYEALIRATPHNPQFVFEQCEALLQRGDRARALRLLGELEARAGRDDDVLARVADFYGRIGEAARALKVLERLAQQSTGDPAHIVDLGDRYFQDGNKPLALSTWKRILLVIQPRSKALTALGTVYLEHDMVVEALAALKEAAQLEPADLNIKKQLAQVFERQKNYKEARAIYVELLAKAKESGDNLLARECRGRLVAVWALERTLEQQVAPLTARFQNTAHDLDAGKTLAEVLLRLRRVAEAETVLRRLVELAPGDPDTYLVLERVLVQQNKIAEAIATLEKLLQVEPKRARELYQRMATYALQIYKDDDAIKYAERAVELNPDDAEGHRRLGAMYRSKQDTERAIVQFRAALAKNERLFVVYFELADLLLARGDVDDADRLFRRVVRGAPDEELVARAARLSMQIHLGRGTLETLEQDLLPLAIGNPQRPLYRRLLVEIYGNLTFGLVQRVRHGTGSDRQEARRSLARIGARAVKPLLDALTDRDIGQQRVAIDVLGYVDNKNAAMPLFAFATGPGDVPLRTRAMIACGRLGEVALVPRFEALLFPKEGDDVGLSDGVASASVWALARLRNATALRVLRRVVQNGTPGMRALALLGLASAHDTASVPLVASVASAVESGTTARAAAAWTLGALGATSEAPTLLGMARQGESLVRPMALVALARLGKREPTVARLAVPAMAEAVVSAGFRDVGAAALVELTQAGAESDGLTLEELPMTGLDGGLDVEAILRGLVPRGHGAAERSAAFVKYADILGQVSAIALQTSADGARAVLGALADGGFAPLVGGDAPEAVKARVAALGVELEPRVVPLARHPDPALRTKAVVLLGRSKSELASAAVADAVSDSNDGVRRVALGAIGWLPSDAALGAVGKALSDPEWPIRVLASEAMGRLGASGRSKEASALLERVALGDTYALVREAALTSLALFEPAAARRVAAVVRTQDAEPRLRALAEALETHILVSSHLSGGQP